MYLYIYLLLVFLFVYFNLGLGLMVFLCTKNYILTATFKRNHNRWFLMCFPSFASLSLRNFCFLVLNFVFPRFRFALLPFFLLFVCCLYCL